jgi:alpha-L-fucosidase
MTTYPSQPDQPRYPRRHVFGMAAGAALAATTGIGVAGTGSTANAATGPAPNATGQSEQSGQPATPVPIALDAYYNNDGIDTSTVRTGDFDGDGYTFPGEILIAGPATVQGVPYTFGPAGANDNVVAVGQQLALPQGHYASLLFLVSAAYGPASGTVTLHYADGSTTAATLGCADWYGGSGVLMAPYRYGPSNSVDDNPVSIFGNEVWTDPTKVAVAVTLPATSMPTAGKPSLHVFALTAQPVVSGLAVALRNAHSTTSMVTPAGPQSVEATVVNVGTEWLAAATPLSVAVNVPGASTVNPAQISGLAPGEQATVRIGIESAGTPVGTTANGQIVAFDRSGQLASANSSLTLGIPDYQPTDQYLSHHQAPYWFDDAKFGIFIHWGVYSVPAWGPVGKEYAEWYWDHMQDPNDPTYAYHKQTYGENFNYDDFIPQFTAAKFDPQSWVRLIANAGAEYFVLTSKHHEGFALWDCKVSGRNAVALGPHRDLVKSLFDASRLYTPQLHNGLYYSLPEWFNPDNPWMGHAPRNPYTLAPVPYTGYTSGKDYVSQYQTPQVMELIDNYDPDIIWFDIGGVNDSRDTMAHFLNHAKNRQRPKDVTYDDRGGIPDHDFTTPEYTVYPNTVVAKWEASRGLDPFSYGYNRATPDNLYMTAEQVVQTLVDIVSKNGNFLLDIGPDFDGTIPAIMQQRLTETGAWLRVNGEAIYGTTYWSKMAQLNNLRFTVKPNQAFYIHSFDQPGDTVTVAAPVPIRPEHKVTLLGYHGGPLSWTQSSGSLVIDVPKAAQGTGQYAWVFKVDWTS